MVEEVDKVQKESEFQQKGIHDNIINITVVIILVGVIVGTAMQYMAPKIPNCYPDLGLVDLCYLQGYFEEGKCTNNWQQFPTGKLILILPKTMKSQVQIIGFAYSPSIFSRGEIKEIKHQFLRELNLRKYEARIVKFNIFMDLNGYPRINIPCEYKNVNYSDRYISKGDKLFIDSDGLTVWRLTFETEKLQQDSQNIYIEFAHDDPGLEYAHDDPCGFFCEYETGSVSVESHNKLPVWGWIRDLWFFRPPLGSISLISIITLIAYFAGKALWKLKIKNHPE